MNIFEKIFNSIKPKNTTFPKVYIPKYIPDDSWEQDESKSIVSNGKYDLKNFSNHEADTIKHVLNVVKTKYPVEYRSMGIVNESWIIKYKPRYVLFEIAILMYKSSTNPIDLFAVSIAYESKGAFFRKEAIDYFERSEPYISPDFMRDFLSCIPLRVYTMFSKLYEQEHNYQRAIELMKIAKTFGDSSNPNFDIHIIKLMEKAAKNPKKRNIKISETQAKFENDVTEAAKYFLRFWY